MRFYVNLTAPQWWSPPPAAGRITPGRDGGMRRQGGRGREMEGASRGVDEWQNFHTRAKLREAGGIGKKMRKTFDFLRKGADTMGNHPAQQVTAPPVLCQASRPGYFLSHPLSPRIAP
jgi:hypothetical protein